MVYLHHKEDGGLNSGARGVRAIAKRGRTLDLFSHRTTGPYFYETHEVSYHYRDRYDLF